MASGLPLPVVVVVMASLLALLLQSASATVEPHIEMVVVNNENKNNKNESISISSSNNNNDNDYCHYQITVRTSGWVLGSGTDSTLSFYVYGRDGNGAYVSHDGSGMWFEFSTIDVLNWDGPCLSQPCVLVVTTDGAGYHADWLMSWLEFEVSGGPAGTETVTFFNGKPGTDGGEGSTWLGPNNKEMQIDYC